MISYFFNKKNNYATEASFETKPFRLHKLDSGPSTQITVTKDEAIELYKKLHTIRRMETAAGNLYKEKIVRGFCHLYSGQVRVILYFFNFNYNNYFLLLIKSFYFLIGSLCGWYKSSSSTTRLCDHSL